MPLPENAIVAPLTKLVPVTVMFCAPVPRPFEFGLSDVIVGRAVTVKALASVTEPPSGFVERGARADPSAPSCRWTRSPMHGWIALRQIQFTVMPVPEKEKSPFVVQLDGKFEPLIMIVWFVAPCGNADGLSDVKPAPR